MLPRSCWKWHSRLSSVPRRLPPPWTTTQCRRWASTTDDPTQETEERFDAQEYYEAAETVDDERLSGLAVRNVTAMGTVAVQQPDPSKVEDLIMSRIMPQNIGRASLPNTLPSILLLLVTPAFAQHALSADLALRLLQRFGENSTASKPLDAITAVVDRLPTPGSNRKGEEGLAYHFTTSPGPLLTFDQVPLQSSTQKPGSLTFAFPRMQRFGHCEVAVQLPLAQTIFSTGLPSTMVHMRYEFDPLSGLLRKSASQRLEAQTVRVPVGAKDLRLFMDTPVVPLTPLRRVVNSMGNIVRKVSCKIYDEEIRKTRKEWLPLDDSAPTQPASQELEAAVTEYFKLNNRQPEPVQVWALIVPRDVFAEYRYTVKNIKNGLKNRSQFLKYKQSQLQDTWVPRETIGDARRVVTGTTISNELSKLIRLGARLCQVLSGGGGWGKKAGLISLDPDTMYSTRDLRADSGWKFDFDTDGTEASFNEQQQQALGDIVREGDGIMLFLAPRGQEQRAARKGDVGPEYRSITFGTLPSSIDESSGGAGADSAAGTEQTARHYANTFGLLSEGGMALTMTRDGETFNQTRLSVPFQQLVVSNVDDQDEGGDLSRTGAKTVATATVSSNGYVPIGGSVPENKTKSRGRQSNVENEVDTTKMTSEETPDTKSFAEENTSRTMRDEDRIESPGLEQEDKASGFSRPDQERSKDAQSPGPGVTPKFEEKA
ncbi:hypothetical protein PRZ48_002076 [Zasmidium cellare]|uniref:Uncharacterized protein n=1 Tax=Zasmidium cellare TaxID=395010 RepID=A0ABR0F4D9_ZASCE|nr:hypothetical protein PRZ48_002076 [Zasmidium cellare]